LFWKGDHTWQFKRIGSKIVTGEATESGNIALAETRERCAKASSPMHIAHCSLQNRGGVTTTEAENAPSK